MIIIVRVEWYLFIIRLKEGMSNEQQNNVPWRGQIAWNLHTPCLFGFRCLKLNILIYQQLICFISFHVYTPLAWPDSAYFADWLALFEPVPDLFHSVLVFMFFLYLLKGITVTSFCISSYVASPPSPSQSTLVTPFTLIDWLAIFSFTLNPTTSLYSCSYAAKKVFWYIISHHLWAGSSYYPDWLAMLYPIDCT